MVQPTTLLYAPFNDYINAKGKKKVEITQITSRKGQKFPEYAHY
jgi:hypothetical protein